MDEDSFVAPGAIHGYDVTVYYTIWEVESREVLRMYQEWGNVHDRFVVAVKKERLTAGHLPIKNLKSYVSFHLPRKYHIL